MNLSGSSISGTVVANLAEAVTTTSPPNNKVITPYILQQFMRAVPATIGTLNPCDGIFTNLSFKTISGDVVATNTETISGTITNKILTPANLKAFIAAGLPIGASVPSTGKFSDLVVTNTITLLNDKIEAYEGGTGTTTYQRGDLLAAEAKTQLARVPIGKNGQYLMVDSGVPGSMRWSSLENIAYASVTNAGIVQFASTADAMAGSSSTKVISPYSLGFLLQNPPIIGKSIPNDAKFKNITATSITGVSATNYEASIKQSTSKFLTPANIPSIMAAPGPIGSNTANSGVFTTVNANTINTTNLIVTNPPWGGLTLQYASYFETFKGVLENKAISPATLQAAFEKPPLIGINQANAAYFTNITVDSIKVKGTPPWSTITPIFASNDEVIQQVSTTKVMSPSHIPIFFANPPPLGNQTPNSATFTNLNSSTVQANTATLTTLNVSEITGDTLATNDDVPNDSSTKLLTPSNLNSIFENPRPLGTITQNTGNFTDLTATTINGECIATGDLVALGESNNTVITPLSLTNFLASPGPIGATTANSANFTDLQANTLSGDVIATLDDLNLGTNNKVVTPSLLSTFLSSSVSGHFTDLYATALYDCEATLQEAQDGQIETKFISPKVLSDYFDQPKAIGSITPNDAFFGTVQSTSATTNTLTASRIAGDVLATYSDVIDGNPDDKIVTPAVLNYLLLNPTAIGITTPNEGKFTSLYFDSIEGNVVATMDEATDPTLVTKIICPATLLSTFSKPPIIGDSGANDAYFNSITASTVYAALGSTDSQNDAFIDEATIASLNGACRSTADDVLTPAADDKYVSPITLDIRFLSPPVIGSAAPNDALFLALTAASLQGEVIAADSDFYGGTTVDNKVVTPAKLSTYLSNISQDISGASAKFTFLQSDLLYGPLGDTNNIFDAFLNNLQVASITGDALATVDELQLGEEDKKIVTPAALKIFLTDPSYALGSGTTGSSINFDIITGNQLNGPLGNDASRFSAYGDIADFQQYQGTGIVNPVELMQKNANGYQLISLDALNTYFSYPSDLGTEVQASGNFTTVNAQTIYGILGDASTANNAFVDTLTANTIAGPTVATFDDFSGLPVPNDKIVTPSLFLDYWSRPGPLGTNEPNEGFFTIVQANSLLGPLGDTNNLNDAFIGTLTATSIQGDCVATTNDLQTTVGAMDKMVSSYALKEYLAQPAGNGIGDGSGPANFSEIICRSIDGDVIGTTDDIIAGTYNKVVPPNALRSFIDNIPAGIQLGGSCDLVVKTAAIDSINGNAIAEVSDLLVDDIATAPKDKIINPLVFRQYLLDPAPIGNVDTSIGNFQVINGGTLYGQLGDATVQRDAYINGILCNTITGKVQATYSDYQNGNVTNKIVSPNLLTQILANPVSVGNQNTTGQFKTLTVEKINITGDIIKPAAGGTGLAAYNRGDLLIGTPDKSLTTLGLASTSNLILQSDLSSNNGIVWNQVPYPVRYLNFSSPKYVANTGSQYTIAYCYARDEANANNINIISQQTVDLTVNGINGIYQSNDLGTCSANGTQITIDGAIDPTTLFLRGDVISVLGEARTIIGISSVSLTVDSAFSTNSFSGNTFRRGGRVPSAHYYLYAVILTDSSLGYLLSTRSMKNGDQLDFQVKAYRQLPFAITTTNTNNARNVLTTKNEIVYVGNYYSTTIGSTTYAPYSLATVVPRIAASVSLRVRLSNASGNNNNILFCLNIQDGEIDLGPTPSPAFITQRMIVPIDSYQRVNAKISSTANNSWGDLAVMGYTVLDM
jgi:hypothetical protein